MVVDRKPCSAKTWPAAVRRRWRVSAGEGSGDGDGLGMGSIASLKQVFEFVKVGGNENGESRVQNAEWRREMRGWWRAIVVADVCAQIEFAGSGVIGGGFKCWRGRCLCW